MLLVLTGIGIGSLFIGLSIGFFIGRLIEKSTQREIKDDVMKIKTTKIERI